MTREPTESSANQSPSVGLSRRERQIMDAVYRLGSATAAEVVDALPDPPGYSAVRTLLRIMEEKGHLRHDKVGVRYVYIPVQSRPTAARSALLQVLQTFFDGSIEQAVATLIEDDDTQIDEAELARLRALLESPSAEEQRP